jgi:protein-tyrosine phosphatase
MGIFSKLFSSEPKLPPADFSVLKCDVHSHLIPGIDDGAQNIEQSLELIENFIRLGYKKLITTPHVMSDHYRNNPEIILSGLSKLREAVKEKNLPIEIDAAAEYYLDYEFEKMIERKELLTFGDNYVLFELPFISAPENLYNAIFQMQMNEYKPIIAHPERYSFWYRDFQKYYDLKDRNVLFQLNINSLTGHYSIETKKIAERMIDEGMIDLLGSDCHNMNHVGLLERCRTEKYLHKILQKEDLINKNL